MALPVEEHTYWFCNNGAVEDDCHFVFDCQPYSDMQEWKELLQYSYSLNTSFTHLNPQDRLKLISFYLFVSMNISAAFNVQLQEILTKLCITLLLYWQMGLLAFIVIKSNNNNNNS